MTLNLNNTDLIEAKSKSYVTFDKLNTIQNIVEKKVISDFFVLAHIRLNQVMIINIIQKNYYLSQMMFISRNL